VLRTPVYADATEISLSLSVYDDGKKKDVFEIIHVTHFTVSIQFSASVACSRAARGSSEIDKLATCTAPLAPPHESLLIYVFRSRPSFEERASNQVQKAMRSRRHSFAARPRPKRGTRQRLSATDGRLRGSGLGPPSNTLRDTVSPKKTKSLTRGYQGGAGRRACCGG
jgi:hypothetical protein